MVLDGKYPINAGVPQGSILDLTFLVLYMNDLPDDFIYDIAVYDDDTTVYSNSDQASNQWQELEFVSELESGLEDTLYEILESSLGWCP